MTTIRIDNLRKNYGSAAAVDGVSLQVASGELFFLLGPSGCGKTTLLRILAGFIEPDSGTVHFGDQDVTRTPPRLRGIAMVFQTYALWPHMTVARNVAYGLQVRGVARAQIAERVDEALRLVQLEGFGDRKPNQLSGGQQQRVALARALIVKPKLLLLDEPLSNLDARLRDELREEIRRLHAATGLTMIYVTHDQKEALTLAGRLAVMDRGKIAQVGTPTDVYARPANRFVAGFLGDSNFLPGTVRENGIIETAIGRLATTATGHAIGEQVICSIRPQALALDRPEAVNGIVATVRDVVFLGDVLQVRLKTTDGTDLLAVSLSQRAGNLQVNSEVTLTIDPNQVVVLPPA
jgi:iron(III) transport system ATP-binding protein